MMRHTPCMYSPMYSILISRYFYPKKFPITIGQDRQAHTFSNATNICVHANPSQKRCTLYQIYFFLITNCCYN